MQWVFGDVHGCVRELDDLLREIDHDPRRDRLWTVGDLVNTGPHSAEAVRLWIEAGGRGVLGNHDIYALLARSGTVRRRPDQLQGLFAARDGDALLGTLRTWPVLVALPRPDGGSPAWLVHAGLRPSWKDLVGIARRLGSGSGDDEWLRDPDVGFATRVRCCSEGGDRVRHVGSAETCPAPHRPWDSYYAGPDLVVHGHWAYRGLYRSAHTLGIDSGCVYGGHLTAWCLEDDRIVQVPCRRPGGYA